MANIPDKHNAEFDTALVDRAWVQMKDQLDVAMPRRKRRAWWWIAPLLIGGIVLSAWLLWDTVEGKSGSAPNVTPREASKAVIADRGNTLEDKADLTNDAPSSAATVLSDDDGRTMPSNGDTPVSDTPRNEDAPSDHDETLANDAWPRGTAAPDSEGTPISGKLIPPTTADIPQDEAVTLSDDSLRRFATAVADGENPALRSDAGVPASDASHNEQVFSRDDAWTASLDNHLVPTLSNPPTLIDNSPRSLDMMVERTGGTLKNGRTAYFLEGRTGIAFGPSVRGGWAVGGGLRHELGERWAVEAVLNYQRESNLAFLNGGNNDVPDSIAEFFDTTTENSGAYNLTLPYKGSDIKTGRVNLYVGARYRLHPRWALAAGGRLGYFTSAYLEVDEARIAGAQGSPLEAAFDGNQLDLYDESVLLYERDLTTNAVSEPYPLNASRWQTGVDFSVHYRLNRRWEASLWYQAHLSDWPSRERSFSGTSAVQLGVRRFFR